MLRDEHEVSRRHVRHPRFPHHENEIAQAQAVGKPFAKCWVHNGLLTVNGEKMSKSLGNFITVEQALKECEGEPDVLKMFFLGAHYRSPMDYTSTNVGSASARYKNLCDFLDRAYNIGRGNEPSSVSAFTDAFEEAMDDDLNTPKALAAFENMVNRSACSVEAADAVRRMGGALGLLGRYEPVMLTEHQRERLNEREAARRRKDYPAGDVIRKEFAAGGLVIEDTASGPVVRRKR
ncbi:MAG: class I tRNA ligase family protein [Candidatus Omnitrophica bacterium]|nr:class I tRNA ligase family protein [Candidatus Omnitrophota bacterium]